MVGSDCLQQHKQERKQDDPLQGKRSLRCFILYISDIFEQVMPIPHYQLEAIKTHDTHYRYKIYTHHTNKKLIATLILLQAYISIAREAIQQHYSSLN